MKYGVSIAVIFTTEVEADSPKEAADKAAAECPYDIENGVPATVWNEAGHYWFID